MSKKVSKQRKTRERGLNVKITDRAKKAAKDESVHVNNNFDKKKASRKNVKKSEKPAKKSADKTLEPAEKTVAKPMERPIEKTTKKLSEEPTVDKHGEAKVDAAEEAKAEETRTEEVRAEGAQTEKVEAEKTENETQPESKNTEVAEESSALATAGDSENEPTGEEKSEANQKEPAKKTIETEEATKADKETALPASFSRNSTDTFADINWAEPESTPDERPVDTEAADHQMGPLPEDLEQTLKLDTSMTEQSASRIITRDVEQVSPEGKVAQSSGANGADFNFGSAEQNYTRMGLSVSDIENVIELPKPENSTVIGAINQPRARVVREPRPTARPSAAKELKDREIKKAIQSVAKMPAKKNRRKRFTIQRIGWPRMVLAISCAATAVFAVAYFINLSASDMSIKVAAMQSGIEASYPSYIPRGYALSDVTSVSGKVVMRFKCDDGEYTISEENSTWDSTALLNNYIKNEYGDDYSVVKEQGLTLYMGDRWEAWVNGGKLYKLNVASGMLTKKQLKTIAVSL